ncbi:MAG: glycosidase, partial [Acidimicrobiales bacterium]
MNDRADPRELLQRYAGNPILRPHDFPTMVNAVLNPGATVIDGRTLLLLRVEHRTGLSSLVVATSQDGLTGWEIDRVRGLAPLSDGFEEHWGIEDPRITRVGDEYFVVYVGYSTAGPLVCLAKTRDFLHWERSGVLQPPEDKDAALFP